MNTVFTNDTSVFNEKTSNPAIDEILRGEISATEAYEKIFEKIDSEAEKERLSSFYMDHKKAVDFWKKQAKMQGAVPQTDSGVWGKVVDTFVATSKVLGESATLNAIKQGEEHGLNNYKKMLESDSISSMQKDEIKSTFIPRQEIHVNAIDAMLKLN